SFAGWLDPVYYTLTISESVAIHWSPDIVQYLLYADHESGQFPEFSQHQRPGKGISGHPDFWYCGLDRGRIDDQFCAWVFRIVPGTCRANRRAGLSGGRIQHFTGIILFYTAQNTSTGPR